MTTFKAIEITTTGVFYAPEYPKEPDRVVYYGMHPEERRSVENDISYYKHHLKTAIRYPVKNQEYAKKKIFQYVGLGDHDYTGIDVLPGIYPYNGEVKLTDICPLRECSDTKCNTCCQKITKVAILIEPPANVPEKPDSSEISKDMFDRIGIELDSANIELEFLRASNKELTHLLSSTIDARNGFQKEVEELVEALKKFMHEVYLSTGNDSVPKWACIIIDDLISKHSNL